MAKMRTGASPLPGRVILKRLFQRIFLLSVLLVVAAYALDYGVLRYKIATKRAPFGTVTVQPYDAVPQKNHKTQFLLEDPQDQTCVNSLFPHMGDSPCWYLTRHREQRIDL